MGRNPSEDHKKARRWSTEALKRRLTLIEALIFGLPFVLVLYALYREGFVWETRPILFGALILLVVLAGMILLRQFFERVMDLGSSVRDAARGRVEYLEKFVAAGELSEVAGAFSEVLTQMKQANEELSRKVFGLSTVQEILRMTGTDQDSKTLLRAILEKSMLVSGAQMGSVFSLDQESGKLTRVHYLGPDQGPPENFSYETSSPIMSRVIRDKKPLRVDDIETDPRTQRANDPKYGSPSFISMPIFAGAEMAGVMNLARKKENKAFDEEDENLLFMAATEMGFALQNAWLKDRLEGLGGLVEDLRDRLEEVEAQKAQTARRLRHAEKMEAVGVLAGGVAHDFNNLLMAIQGNVSLMLLDLGSDQVHQERLNKIEKQVKSGAKLTGQLLGFARKSPEDWQEINVNRLVEETSEAFGRTRKDITVNCRPEPGLDKAGVDPSQLEQILWNLFINAGDAMADGGFITVTTKNATPTDMAGFPYTPKPGNYVMISVADTGPGMEAQTLAHIYEPFFTTKEKGKGTGLGLATVFEIVKMHGGYIDAISEPGAGAAFQLFFPSTKKSSEPS